jgi:PIN domain nuclease of toxin-antitoxin system
MSAVLADTHSILWYLFDRSQLSAAAAAAFASAEQAGERIYLSVVTVIEVRYLVEKRRLKPVWLTGLTDAVDDPARPVEALDITMAVARATAHIPRSIVPDLPDRIIAATALVHGLPLVTADRQIRAAPIQTIW